MTVIAWDGQTLASDSLALSNTYSFHIRKILKISDRLLVGYSGPASLTGEMFNWAKGGFQPDKVPSAFLVKGEAPSSLLAIEKTQDGSLMRVYENATMPFEPLTKFFAIGAGASAAGAVMSIGGSAVDGVLAAINTNVLCAGPIETVSFD